ncbi:MAG TPA: 3-phosphoshikimate 1-carboxyvinyltransferase [Bacteroidia bacterium]|nr:3-phosphoshikimate 1-carboxyvinyltransferase [Bacteroidia bacterium]
MPFQISGTSSSEPCAVKLTSSKSISNRFLLVRALCKEPFSIHNLATAEDTVLLEDLLMSEAREFDAKDAGTVFRFLLAYLSIRPGTFVLKGTKRMNERPVGPLMNALNSLGANITCLGQQGFPPLKIEGATFRGGHVKIEAGTSSQFISALLMIAPVLEEGLKIQLEGEVVSAPYIKMTVEVMSLFGVDAVWNGNEIHVPHSEYRATAVSVEADWSSAAFWYLISALSPNRKIFLEGLQQSSIQGDSKIAEWMSLLGVKTVFDEAGATLVSNGYSSWSQTAPLQFDFNDCPDLFPPMLVSCAALNAEAKFTSLQNLKHKESDRLTVLLHELGKCGMRFTLDTDQRELLIPNQKLSPPGRVFQSHGDHRVAMALAPLAQIFGSITMDTIAVVQKSYPEFWNQLVGAGFAIRKIA